MKKIFFAPGEKIPGTSWTVLEEAKSKNGNSMYKCRCECGTVKKVSAKNLKYGKTKSCGCRKPTSNKGWYPLLEKNDIDLSGRIFGNVEVLEKISGNGTMSIWKCKCLACGKIFEVVQSSLTRGTTKSCGCLHYKQASEKCKEYLGITDGTNISVIKSKKKSKANTSGVRGISQNAKGKYIAYIGFQNKLHYLGSYETLEEAATARKTAEKEKYEKFLKSKEEEE